MDDRYTWESLLNRYREHGYPFLMSRVGHDVRSQLNNIVGNATLLRMALHDERFSLQEKADLLSTIADASQIIDTIVEAALEVEEQFSIIANHTA